MGPGGSMGVPRGAMSAPMGAAMGAPAGLMSPDMGRSPTFVVGSERQRGTLDALVRRGEHLSEQYVKNKPLCFNARAFQRTHPRKASKGHKDADATLCSPMLVGVADGVSQIEEFGIDASLLPNELLNAVEELAVAQLFPESRPSPHDQYMGPVAMMRQAYESTESLGSTTILLAIMDNSSQIHGKLHPMIAVLSIGDCEILILRRVEGGRYSPVFHTEMQRIDGNAQSPLQLARVDASVDPHFDESIAYEVIERGSAVHCVSAYEGDLVVLGSDGVFDNLFIDEIVMLCNQMIPPTGNRFQPCPRSVLGDIARRVVEESHAKTKATSMGRYPETPIGRGGKVDDTSCVVGQVVEWTDDYSEAWSRLRSRRKWEKLFSCGLGQTCNDAGDGDDERQRYPSNPNGNFSHYNGGAEYDGSFANASGYDGGQAGRTGYGPPHGRRRAPENVEQEVCSTM